MKKPLWDKSVIIQVRLPAKLAEKVKKGAVKEYGNIRGALSIYVARLIEQGLEAGSPIGEAYTSTFICRECGKRGVWTGGSKCPECGGKIYAIIPSESMAKGGKK